MEKLMSADLINIVELAFSFGLENIITFLAFHLCAVFFSIKNEVCRYDVKCLALASNNVMNALLTGKWQRLLIVNKMRHYAFSLISNRKNTFFFNSATKFFKK